MKCSVMLITVLYAVLCTFAGQSQRSCYRNVARLPLSDISEVRVYYEHYCYIMCIENRKNRNSAPCLKIKRANSYQEAVKL